MKMNSLVNELEIKFWAFAIPLMKKSPRLQHAMRNVYAFSQTEALRQKASKALIAAGAVGVLGLVSGLVSAFIFF